MKLSNILVSSVFTLVTAVCFSQEIKQVKATDLEKIIKESKTPLLINFWATWCVPCIEELPHFQEEVKKHQGDSVQLLLVSLDLKDQFPDKLSAFAKKRKYVYPILWLNETNADYFCPKVDEKWSGSIPATLFINNKKGYRKFMEQQLTRAQLQKEIMAIL